MASESDDRAMLCAYLEARDEACPNCGYNLRGLKGERCPECDQRLVLRVGLVEPRLAAFVSGVIGVGMSFGFCVLMLVWWLVMKFISGGAPPMYELLPLLVGTVFAGAVLRAWISGRRGWCGRLSDRRRWVAVGVATAVAAGCPVWFMLTVG